MQCFRCGKDLPPGDGLCPTCGAQLPYLESYCNQCGTAILCDECRGTLQQDAHASATGDGLQYEYRTVTIPLRVYQYGDEPYQQYLQRVHDYLVRNTQELTLEGWETVDPLDYAFLDRRGLAAHSLWGVLTNRPAQSVTIHLRRLIGGPPAEEHREHTAW
jgi:hypothetical protein